MKRTSYKEAVEIRGHIKYGTLTESKILEKYDIKPKAFDRIISKECLSAPPKQRDRGTNVKGEDCGRSKLKEIDVYNILKLWEKGLSQTETASIVSNVLKVKIYPSTVGKIIRGESWNDLTIDYCKNMLKKQIHKINKTMDVLAKQRSQRFYLKDKLRRLAKAKNTKKGGMTEPDAKMILFYKGIISAKELQVMTSKKVSLVAIYDVLNGDSWKHLQKGNK